MGTHKQIGTYEHAMFDNENDDKMHELIFSLTTAAWSGWEHDFIEKLQGREYDDLSKAQQSKVDELYSKLEDSLAFEVALSKMH